MWIYHCVMVAICALFTVALKQISAKILFDIFKSTTQPFKGSFKVRPINVAKDPVSGYI